MSQGSLAYRKNEAAIRRGDVPEKYRRIVPHVSGPNVLEIGSAEGVLSLLIAESGANVTGLELRPDRHEQALKLRDEWRSLGRPVDRCRLINGDIRDLTDLLAGIDTVVAVRSIYYLRESIGRVFDAMRDNGVKRVVLCGNRNRAENFSRGVTLGSLEMYNFYASIDGMTKALVDSGYRIQRVVPEGDPIVVGMRD